MSDQNYQPVLNLAARHAVWKVEKTQLVALAKLQKVSLPRAATLLEVVVALIRTILPGSTEEDHVRFAKFRVAHAEQIDTWHDEIAVCDEAISVLEPSDAQAAKTEKKQANVEKHNHKEFHKEFTWASRKVSDDRATFNQRTYKQKIDEFMKKYKKHVPDLPASDIPVQQARSMIPPGSSLWQDDKYRSWQGHYPPYPRRGRSWRTWGEGVALKFVLRYIWCKYLTDEGWDLNMCPVAGIFEANEHVEDVVLQ